jgi:hypothetical protein
MAGTPACSQFGENGTYERPDGTFVYGTRSPLGFDFGSDGYDRNFANSNYNSFQASLERKSGPPVFWQLTLTRNPSTMPPDTVQWLITQTTA